MIKDFFQKIKSRIAEQRSKKIVIKNYSNRFLKFYHLNRQRLLKERYAAYYSRRKSEICVRCKNPVVSGIIFCEYHQMKQKEYNQKARSYRKSL